MGATHRVLPRLIALAAVAVLAAAACSSAPAEQDPLPSKWTQRFISGVSDALDRQLASNSEPAVTSALQYCHDLGFEPFSGKVVQAYRSTRLRSPASQHLLHDPSRYLRHARAIADLASESGDLPLLSAFGGDAHLPRLKELFANAPNQLRAQAVRLLCRQGLEVATLSFVEFLMSEPPTQGSWRWAALAVSLNSQRPIKEFPRLLTSPPDAPEPLLRELMAIAEADWKYEYVSSLRAIDPAAPTAWKAITLKTFYSRGSRNCPWLADLHLPDLDEQTENLMAEMIHTKGGIAGFEPFFLRHLPDGFRRFPVKLLRAALAIKGFNDEIFKRIGRHDVQSLEQGDLTLLFGWRRKIAERLVEWDISDSQWKEVAAWIKDTSRWHKNEVSDVLTVALLSPRISLRTLEDLIDTAASNWKNLESFRTDFGNRTIDPAAPSGLRWEIEAQAQRTGRDKLYLSDGWLTALGRVTMYGEQWVDDIVSIDPLFTGLPPWMRLTPLMVRTGKPAGNHLSRFAAQAWKLKVHGPLLEADALKWVFAADSLTSKQGFTVISSRYGLVVAKEVGNGLFLPFLVSAKQAKVVEATTGEGGYLSLTVAAKEAPSPEFRTAGAGIWKAVLFPPEDTDKDGLPDKLEKVMGASPEKPDTDGDGVGDGADPAPLDKQAPALRPLALAVFLNPAVNISRADWLTEGRIVRIGLDAGLEVPFRQAVFDPAARLPLFRLSKSGNSVVFPGIFAVSEISGEYTFTPEESAP